MARDDGKAGTPATTAPPPSPAEGAAKGVAKGKGGARPAAKRGRAAGFVPGPVEDGLAEDGPPFFLCDVLEAIPKGDLASMEHPIFTLATRPDLRVLRYAHRGTEVTVTPSVAGLATIHDKDVLIYCVSQLMAALNAGRPTSRTLRLRARDLLAATGRETSGDAYRRLCLAFERLAGTRLTTNLETGGRAVTTGFGLIERWEVVRRTDGAGGAKGRMVSVSVTLSDWLYAAVLSKAVLTLDRGYFDLRKPLERRVYELARKHCGRQPEWRCSLEVLQKKSGSASPRRVFRRMMRDMIAAQPLPGYLLEEAPGDLIRVTPRAPAAEIGAGAPQLRPETHDRARALMPGWDVHALEAEWRGVWEATGRQRLRSADAAFLGWVAKRAG